MKIRLRTTLLFTGLALAPLAFSAAGQTTGPKTPPLIIPSMYGQDLFNFYCASCHGRDGQGRGPVARALNVSPPDLTTLAVRHGGKFPNEFVESFVTGNRATPASPVHRVRSPVGHRVCVGSIPRRGEISASSARHRRYSRHFSVAAIVH